METRVQRIHAKLLRLIETDTEFKTFGSNEPWNGHQYLLNDALSDKGVSNFENYAHVKLPEEYKLFLTEIADGDAGPFYGLYHLGEAVEQTRSRITESTSQEDLIACFSEFPISKTEVATYLDNVSTLENIDAASLYEPDFSLSPFPVTDAVKGILFLSEYGCGGNYVLVITGDCFGQVWFYQVREYLVPICDVTGKIFSFFDWYEYWLDNSLKAL